MATPEDTATALRTRIARWESNPPTVSATLREKRRLAAAMRVVIERLVQTDAPEAELAAAADALERYAAQLDTHPRPNRYEGFAETSNAGDTGGFFDHSPLIGLANPLAAARAAPTRIARVHGRAPGAPYEARLAPCTAARRSRLDEVGFANALPALRA